jgi:cellulose synthase/poly-beta-1,6-N-acetylglucosamine synthase-like glycosyltransferase
MVLSDGSMHDGDALGTLRSRPAAQHGSPTGPDDSNQSPKVFYWDSRVSSFGAPVRGLPLSPVNPRNGTIIIPCYNHEGHLGEVVSELHAVAPGLRVVIVDDGSDPSVGDFPGAEVVRHSSNRGKGAAILTGILCAADSDFIIFVDADGQHPVRAIPRLLEAFNTKPTPDVVTASRDFVHDSSIPMRHRIANLVLSMEFALLYGKYIADITNGFRIVRIKTLRAITMRFRRYEVDIEMLRSMLKSGLLIRSVPISGVRYDAPSSVGRGIRMTATLALSMLAARFSPRAGTPEPSREHAAIT